MSNRIIIPSRAHGRPGVSVDRLPPHSLADEQAMIGCQLLDPNQTIPEVFSKLKGDVGAFYDLRNQQIQAAIFEMYDERTPVDIVTLCGRLRDKQALDQCGGVVYLSECQDMVPSAANLPTYVETVCMKHLLRRTIQLCMSSANRIYEFEGDANEILDDFEREALALRTVRGAGEMTPIREVVAQTLNDIEEMFKRQGSISGLSTGFPDLDAETDGLHGGEYILIAAFPSVGKTSLAMNIVEHVALDLGLPVGVFSAEMSARSLVRRGIASVGRVNMRMIRDGKMGEEDFPRIQNAAGKLSAAKLYIDDTSDLSIQSVRARGRRMVQRYGVKLLVADYAQMFCSPGAENHTMELDQVSKGFKNMAKELDIPVIVLSQLTEDSKGNIHLKGARALGEDADGYWLLKRPKETPDGTDEEAELIELWLRKQRNGARNVKIKLTFLKAFTRFESASKYENP